VINEYISLFNIEMIEYQSEIIILIFSL